MKEELVIERTITTVQRVVVPEEYVRLLLCRHLSVPEDCCMLLEEGQVTLTHTTKQRELG